MLVLLSSSHETSCTICKISHVNVPSLTCTSEARLGARAKLASKCDMCKTNVKSWVPSICRDFYVNRLRIFVLNLTREIINSSLVDFAIWRDNQQCAANYDTTESYHVTKMQTFQSFEVEKFSGGHVLRPLYVLGQPLPRPHWATPTLSQWRLTP